MGERDAPLGINTAIGAVAVVVCCVVPVGLDTPGRDARLAVLALGVAVFAATVGDLASVAVTTVVAFVLFDGFVEDGHGELVWHGRADVVRVGVLCGAGLVGLVIGALRRWAERRHGPDAGVHADESRPQLPDLPFPRTSETAGDHEVTPAATASGPPR